MKGWRECTLGDVIELKRGYDLPQKNRQAGEFPIVSSSGVSGSHSEGKIKGPGVVTGRYGTIGVVHFVEGDYWPLNTTLYVCDFKGNDPRFISYFLRGIDFQAYSDKAAVPGVNRNHLHEAKVRLPASISDQRAIAGVLEALDAKSELNRRLNENLEAATRIIFRDWFVDFGPTVSRLNGRNPYLAPDLWSVFPSRLDKSGCPMNWNPEPLYDQAIWVNGAAFKDMHFSAQPDALPVVKIAELKSGISSTTRFTNTNLGDRYKIENGEILFSWSGNPDSSIDTFVWTHGRAWLNQHIFAVRPNGKCSQVFLHTMLKILRPEFAEIARNKQTTGLGHVTQQDLMRIKVIVPDARARLAFDAVASPMYKRFVKNLFENQTLVTLRDQLLPKLMSGELTVKNAEKIVGEAT